MLALSKPGVLVLAILVLLFFGFPHSPLVLAQPHLFGSRTYGGTGDEVISAIDETVDGGFILAGQTSSFGAGNWDGWILRLNPTGKVTWQKTYGGNGSDFITSVQQTANGGFIAAGAVKSFDERIHDFRSDVWVLRLNAAGNILWSKTYGNGAQAASSVKETSDGSFVVAAVTLSFGTSGVGTGHWDFWVIKLGSDGNLVWQRTYGGISDEVPFSIVQTFDGGYAVTGYVSGSGSTDDSDMWLLRLDMNGDLMWQRSYGGRSGDFARSVIPTSEEGFFLAGTTYSFGAGKSDVWALKLDTLGEVVWQMAYGGSEGDDAWAARQTSDGGFVIAGSTWSFAVGEPNPSGADAWLIKIDRDGRIEWERTFGGVDGEEARDVLQTSDGGYVVVGSSSSFEADFPSFPDAWVFRVNSGGDALGCAFVGTSSATVTETSANATTTNQPAGVIGRNLEMTEPEIRQERTSATEGIQC